MTTTTRRNVLTGALAAALPVAAAAAPAAVDPIDAAIEAHRVAFWRWYEPRPLANPPFLPQEIAAMAVIDSEDDDVDPKDRPCVVQCILRKQMMFTHPTTVAGVERKLSYLLSEHDNGTLELNCIDEVVDVVEFLRHLRDSLAQMS